MPSARPGSGPPADPAPPALRARLDYDDARLLAECTLHTYRARGPGGQHRNKTCSAVRLHHRPSGLIVTASESRSQQQNKGRALRRLREALALAARAPLPARLAWPAGVQIVDRRLRLSPRNPARFHVLALLLDALLAARGRLREAAGCLGLSPSSLSRFLAGHPHAWAAANRIRRQAGLPPLRK